MPFFRLLGNLVAARKSSKNDGSNLIVRKVYTMENGQPMKTENESESKEVTSDGSISLPRSENTESDASKSTPIPTTATTQNASKKIWKSAELEVLRSKAGLVAGALADFQGAKGMVLASVTEYRKPSGRKYKAVKLLLFVDEIDLVAVKTKDGLDFDLVAEEK